MAKYKKTITLSNGKSFVTIDGSETPDSHKAWTLSWKDEWLEIKSVFAPSKNDSVCIRMTDISCIEFEEIKEKDAYNK